MRLQSGVLTCDEVAGKVARAAWRRGRPHAPATYPRALDPHSSARFHTQLNYQPPCSDFDQNVARRGAVEQPSASEHAWFVRQVDAAVAHQTEDAVDFVAALDNKADVIADEFVPALVGGAEFFD